jgi:hypothetical protein
MYNYVLKNSSHHPQKRIIRFDPYGPLFFVTRTDDSKTQVPSFCRLKSPKSEVFFLHRPSELLLGPDHDLKTSSAIKVGYCYDTDPFFSVGIRLVFLGFYRTDTIPEENSVGTFRYYYFGGNPFFRQKGGHGPLF